MELRKLNRRLTVVRPHAAVVAASAAVVVPGLLADAGEHTTRRFLELFTATIRSGTSGRPTFMAPAGSSPGASAITLPS